MRLPNVWQFLVRVGTAWSEDKAPRMGAALAYYSVFALAPLLVLAIGIGGLLFDRDVARSAILQEVQNTIGEPASSALEAMIENVQKNEHSGWAALVGFVTLLIGATGVFGELQDALNTVWKVKPKQDRSWKDVFRERFFSFAIVLGTGFLLLVSLVATAMLTALGSWLSGHLPGGAVLWRVANAVISFGSITLLFALIFKLLPDVRLKWRSVWVGAAVTALLFTGGKFAIGLYLGRSSSVSTFGAAASLVIILLWVYYSAQILLFGAELTRVLVQENGERAPVQSNAQPVTASDRAKQGLEPEPAVAGH